MHRCVAVAAVLFGLAGSAIADDPRGLFGLGDSDPNHPRPALTSPPSCDDGAPVGCAGARDDQDPISPASIRTILSRAYLLTLPIADARHDTVATFVTGSSRDEAGVAFGGATGLENRWTIEGAPTDSLRTGGVELRVPVTFLDSLLVTAGGFSARDRTSTGGTIDARLRGGTPHHELEARAWGSYDTNGRRRPTPNGAYQVRRATADLAPGATVSLVATGPLGHGAWYAAGVAPQLSPLDYTWTARRLVDDDGDGNPDGNPGPVQTAPIEETGERSLDFVIPAMARVGWERGPHALDVTAIGQLAHDGVFLANATTLDTAIQRSTLAANAIATYRGTWKHTRVRAQLSWQHSHREDTPRDPAAAGVQLQSAYIPAALATDPTLSAACKDSMDPAEDPVPTLQNCQVPLGFFVSGGAGLLVEQTGDRPTVTADLTHARGRHVLRIGVTAEDARLITDQHFTGGSRIFSLAPGVDDTQHFYGATCGLDPVEPCDYVDAQELRYRTRYAAGYVEDTFTPVPGLRVDAGLRVEVMDVGTVLTFDHELAPRLGIAWDPTRVGAARLWASYARTYALLPTGLGSTLLNSSRIVGDLVIMGVGNGRFLDGGGGVPVAAGIDPVTQDEGTAGVSVGQPGLAQATFYVQGRSVRRGLETVSLSRDDLTVAFDNPGRTEMMPPARRDTIVTAGEVTVLPSPATAVRAGYSYTQAVGNWTGPFDPRQGANLYASTDFDLDRVNLSGRLPTDAGHRLFIEASKSGRVHGLQVGGALRGTIASGRPRSVLANTDQGIVFLIPRGADGRSGMLSQLNIRLAARWHGTDLTLDAFNVFDHREATNLDEIYSQGSVQPISGGTPSDLVWLTNEGARDHGYRRTAFRVPTAYQAPFGVTLGIHRAF